ncbi:MAG: SMC-Scp complex subunit ScpB [Firmicutes bacterium]|nr:SMC-Scp complex subunit ScpB [Bacillota bacterium]
MMDRQIIKSALESMLFVWGDPLEAKAAAKVFEADEEYIMGCLKELQDDYEGRSGGIVIQRFGSSFQLCTREENRDFIEKLCNPVKERKLSKSALEVLAVIAYKQPVTRGEIESIRGVRCTYVLEGLQQKGLIEEVGRSEAIGRPVLYGTTDLFLRHFGIESLSELPDIETDEFMTDKNE